MPPTMEYMTRGIYLYSSISSSILEHPEATEERLESGGRTASLLLPIVKQQFMGCNLTFERSLCTPAWLQAAPLLLVEASGGSRLPCRTR